MERQWCMYFSSRATSNTTSCEACNIWTSIVYLAIQSGNKYMFRKGKIEAAIISRKGYVYLQHSIMYHAKVYMYMGVVCNTISRKTFTWFAKYESKIYHTACKCMASLLDSYYYADWRQHTEAEIKWLRSAIKIINDGLVYWRIYASVGLEMS